MASKLEKGTSTIFSEQIKKLDIWYFSVEMDSKAYFNYYGMLMHQQNMLQDFVRTNAYYQAILDNAADFQGKVVLDVGAGSGILSFFAAQAGAKRVYAVEASPMVNVYIWQ